jgi:nitrite reductase/ring-hydroxylating ferredoxin subunit
VAEHVVGRVGEIPKGTRKIVKVRDVEIGVFNVDGTFHALPNLCIHQWGPLCEGRLAGTTIADSTHNWKLEWAREGEIIVCPWHSLEFDLISGQCLAYRKVRLRKYPVVVTDDEVRLVL